MVMMAPRMLDQCRYVTTQIEQGQAFQSRQTVRKADKPRDSGAEPPAEKIWDSGLHPAVSNLKRNTTV
ncbi:hypothetical protein GGI1_16609 [Acidithiobacillus sp. GGI-221]|nr:hypothetical protein GGI1_16609 [Acidithiobacillus sp. GGI-221]